MRNIVMTISEYLIERGMRFQHVLRPPAPTAARRAHASHLAGESVAKGVLLASKNQYLLAVLPSTRRVDLLKLAKILALDELNLASEDDLELVFHDCQRGSAPPFGRLYGIPIVVDQGLAGKYEILLDGHCRHDAYRMNFDDFITLENPLIADFATTIRVDHPPIHRKAG
jgi:Ala-tRNA(Pro) deacylase